ncbi:MAG: hypothetical protein AAF681_09795 [Pseudomonadota bacterium]
MRIGAGLLVLLLVGMGASASDARQDLLQELRPCLEPSEGLGTLTSEMQRLDWTPILNPDERLLEDLAWIHTVFYLGADTGGASLENILDIQRKAAGGLLRKKDIPQSKSRFFTRENGEERDSLMIAWREPRADVLEVECRLSIRSDASSIPRPEMTTSFQKGNRLQVGAATVDVMLFDRSRLPDHTPPVAVIHTSYRDSSN